MVTCPNCKNLFLISTGMGQFKCPACGTMLNFHPQQSLPQQQVSVSKRKKILVSCLALLGIFVCLGMVTLVLGSKTKVGQVLFGTPIPTHSAAAYAAWGIGVPPYSTSTPSGLQAQRVPYATLQQFLLTDLTKYNHYQITKYMCLQFAMDVVSNANSSGIEAYVVILDYESLPSGVLPGWVGRTQEHAIVAFPTSDHGIVYYDPVLGIVSIEKGESECTIDTHWPPFCRNIFKGLGYWNSYLGKTIYATADTPLIIAQIYIPTSCNYETSECYLEP